MLDVEYHFTRMFARGGRWAFRIRLAENDNRGPPAQGTGRVTPARVMAFQIDQSNHLFSACQLRAEESTRDNYAADLQRSLNEELSTPESARQFFQSTYPTNGMKDICRRIFRRLKLGDLSNEPSVYRLGSAFGGGKTHTLIALAGAAWHSTLIAEGVTTVPDDCAPDEEVRLVTFTGENSDVERGALIPGTNDVRAKSLVGHLAWQLGGETAFNEFKTYDDNFTSPGSEDLRLLLGEQPCLILVDELVQWLDRMENSAHSSQLPNIRTLFSSLAQAVGACPNAVLVVTTPDPASDAYKGATQEALDILDEVDSVFARISHQTIPSDPPDLPAIIRHRLFSHVDPNARDDVSSAYAELCRRSSALIAPPPQDRTVFDWFKDNYPLHPDTLRVIVERIASNENFQNTRGILRLLGMTAHHLKNSDQGGRALLIHPHHIDPANSEIHAELTTRIERGEFESAIVADIIGPESTAARIDGPRPTRPARRIARTALLASLTPIGSTRGATASELVRSVITPYDEDPSVVANAITEFRNTALFVNDDPGVADIQFTTFPNLNRMLLERRNSVPTSEVNQRIKQAITDCFTMPRQRSQNHLQVAVFPSGSDIPDNPDSVALGIINYEWLTQGEKGVVQAIANFSRNGPGSGGQAPRQYVNNFVVLVADRDQRGDMVRHARRYAAARYIKDNPPATLQPYQRQNLETELTSAEKDLFIAIQRLYVNLYYPSSDHLISDDTRMQYVVISPEVASEKPGDGQYAVIQTLSSRRKLITPQNPDLNPTYWQERPNLRSGKIELKNVKEEFARVPSNYMLLNGSVADELLRKALDRSAIVIQTGAGQTITAGSEFRVTDDPQAWVYLRDKACDDCLHYQDDCVCSREAPQYCPDCGNELHPGQCQSEDLGRSLFDVAPSFSSGLEPQPLNVLAADLRHHMEQHGMSTEDVAYVKLHGDKAEFINFVCSLIGQNDKTTVSYNLRRTMDLELTVRDMDTTEWSRNLSRIAPALERLEGMQVMAATVNIAADDSDSAPLVSFLSQLPPSRVAGMEAAFIPRSNE